MKFDGYSSSCSTLFVRMISFSENYVEKISLGLILLFSWLIIIQFSNLMFFSSAGEVLPQKTKDIQISPRENSFDAIEHSSFFGIYIPHDLHDAAVKKSMLDVTLVGVLLADNTEHSRVIIRLSNGEEKTYKLGELIPGGALIKRIMAGGILLERHGTLERLSLAKNKLSVEPMAKSLKEE